MPDPTDGSDLRGKVAVLDRQLTDFSKNVNESISAQRAENIRLYDAINVLTDKFSSGLDSIKSAMARQGKINPQFIWSVVVGSLASLATVAMFVNFYVSSQNQPIKNQLEATVQQLERVRTDDIRGAVDLGAQIAAMKKEYDAEDKRLLVANAVADAERRLAVEDLHVLQNRLYSERQEELIRLRKFHDDSLVTKEGAAAR